jgi:hypothetical protein
MLYIIGLHCVRYTLYSSITKNFFLKVLFFNIMFESIIA